MEQLKKQIIKEEPTDKDDFENVIKELGFESTNNLSYELTIKGNKYILEYEGYAYVLYKIVNYKHEDRFADFEIKFNTPIADFQDANKLRTFVNILKNGY